MWLVTLTLQIGFVLLVSAVIERYRVNADYSKLNERPWARWMYYFNNLRHMLGNWTIRRVLPEKNVGSVKQLYIFPIKSVGNFPVTSWQVDEHGLKYDRQYAIGYFDANAGQYKIITQREVPKLSAVKYEYYVDSQGQDWFNIYYDSDSKWFCLPAELNDNMISKYCEPEEKKDTTLWNIDMSTLKFKKEHLPEEFLAWAGIPARYSKFDTFRMLYSRNGKFVITGSPSDLPALRSSLFHDYYPLLITAELDVDYINGVVASEMDPNYPPAQAVNFRGNVVLQNTRKPFDTDTWDVFDVVSKTGERHRMRNISKCTRCSMPNIVVATGSLKKIYITRALNKYRRVDPGTTANVFGINVIHYDSSFAISVGDTFEVLERKIGWRQD